MTKRNGAIAAPAQRSRRSPCERLLRLDTCAVSDALDSLGLSGVAAGIQSITVAGRFAGRVKTVQLARAGTQTARRHP